MARADAGRACVVALAGLLTLTVAACGADEPSSARGIVFVAEQRGDLEIFRGSGGRLINLTNSPPGERTHGRDEQPAWSPDGRRIAFVSTRDHRGDGNEAGELYVMQSNGENPKRLTKDFAPQMRPGWLPDGRIVYTHCDQRFTRCRFMAVGSDGEHRETLLELPNFVLDATPSPDGTRIAYTRTSRSATGAASLWIQRLDRSVAQRVGEGGTPAWSPDGRRLSFVTDRDRNGRCVFHDCFGFAPEIYVMNADGTGVRRLTRTTAYEVMPVFSPSGREIAFARTASERVGYELWAVRVDGTGERRITRTRLSEWMPDWR